MSGTPAPAARTRPLTRPIDELEASDPADPAQAQAQAQAQEAIDEAIVVNQFIDTQLPGQQCALTRRVATFQWARTRNGHGGCRGHLMLIINLSWGTVFN